MNAGAEIGDFSPRMSVPPNHSTITITHVPRNSLTGCAIAWRMVTRMVALRSSLLTLRKRADIFFSARKALTMRRPPSVSSICDIVSLSFACASSDFCLSLRPTSPIIHPRTGNTVTVNSVSSQLI